MLGDNKKFKTILQLCKWHTAESIKRRLVHASKYSKERRGQLTDLVHAWIKAPTEEEAIKA
jgi:hypothetical protein